MNYTVVNNKEVDIPNRSINDKVKITKIKILNKNYLNDAKIDYTFLYYDDGANVQDDVEYNTDIEKYEICKLSLSQSDFEKNDEYQTDTCSYKTIQTLPSIFKIRTFQIINASTRLLSEKTLPIFEITFDYEYAPQSITTTTITTTTITTTSNTTPVITEPITTPVITEPITTPVITEPITTPVINTEPSSNSNTKNAPKTFLDEYWLPIVMGVTLIFIFVILK